MPWWAVLLVGLGGFAAGVVVGYVGALLQVGKGMQW